jgi:hypothetical protein
VLGEEVRNLCCSAAVPLDHTIGPENLIDFKVAKHHYFGSLRPRQVSESNYRYGVVAVRGTYLVYTCAFGKRIEARARPASLNRSRGRFNVEEESSAAKEYLATLVVRELCAV